MDAASDSADSRGHSSDRLDSLDRLLYDCLGRPEEERTGALERLCREHPEHAERLRKRFALLSEAGLLEGAPSPRLQEELPRTLGEFRLLRRLGGGGMGVVYLAEQAKLDRKVALKLIKREQIHFPATRERFHREALAASRLDHPGICSVYDVGEVDGAPYIAMRYLEGETLAKKIARAAVEGNDGQMTAPVSIPVADESDDGSDPGSTGGPGRRGVMHVVRLIEQTARALHVAHEAGLVHRDVKPGNIMVTPAGDPVVLDFGLARDEAPGHQSLTQSGDVLGTPAYMSPEQISPKGVRPDRRTDVYSLGVTLYECLTLRLPFEANTRESLYRQILTAEATNPSRYNRHLPRDLKVVLEKAMERDRGRRYPTALELAEDLRRVRSYEPIRARSAGPVLRLRRWTQRNPVAATLLVVLAFGLAAALYLLDLVRGEQAVTKKALDQVSAEQRTATALALAGESARVAKWKPVLSLLLAREAVRREERWETVSQLHSAVAGMHEVQSLDHGPVGLTVRFSRDGSALLAVAWDPNVRLYSRRGDRWETRVLPHDAHATDARFSPDGELVVTCTSDGKLTVWNRTGGELAVLRGHGPRAYGAIFSPDGNQILSHGRDGTVRIWQRTDETWKESIPPIQHTGPVRVAMFSPDGDRIVTGVANLTLDWKNTLDEAKDFDARVFDPTGRRLATLKGHRDSISQVAFSPVDKNLVLTASFDRTARLWDVRKATCVATFFHDGAIRSAEFSPTGDRIVTASLDCTAKVWDLRGRVLFRSLHEAPVHHATFATHGHFILTASGDGTVRLFNLQGHECLRFRRNEQMHFVAWSPDAEFVAAAGNLSGCLWSLSRPDLPLFLGHERSISCVRFTRDRRLVVTSSVDNTIRFWDRNGTERVEMRLRIPEGVWHFDLAPDARKLAYIGRRGSLFIRDLDSATPRARRIPPAAPRTFFRVAYSPQGDRLVATLTRRPGRALVLDRDGRVLRTFAHGAGSDTNHAAFSPDGESLVTTGGGDRTAIVWHVESGRKLATLPHETEELVADAAWSSDGRRLVTAGKSKAVIWEVDGWQPVATMYFTEVRPRNVCFSPADDRLVLSSAADAARLWRGTGSLLAELREPSGCMQCAILCPEGKRVLTGNTKGIVRSWAVDTQELRAIADRRAYRDFTPAERKSYAHLLGR